MTSTKDFCEELRAMSLEDLQWILGCHCGPHNVLLAYRLYGGIAPNLMRLVNDEIAYRMIDDILLEDDS